jgi:chromosome partitioning protein
MAKSPKTIATLNFKGGVGKTTITWCLADILSSFSDAKVLMCDLDAQMSLTHAIGLDPNTGELHEGFGEWYERAVTKNRTIFHALDKFTTPGKPFDFPIGFDFIYQLSENCHFIPSVEDLYWQELEVFDRDAVKDFIRRLLGKITNSRAVPNYDYVLFDCPPSFTLLSYSVLACCDLVLIPVNPDYFAARGTSLILNSLRYRIEPHPIPKIGVFMNKTKTWREKPTKEAAFYWRTVKQASEEAAISGRVNVRFFDSWIKERVGIKRAITGGGVPPELIPGFRSLWGECVEFLDA